MRLKDKIVAITGGGSGIGLEAVKLFAKEGAKVYILEVNQTKGEEVETAIINEGGNCSDRFIFGI